jgi:hypothetical protein
MCIEAIGAKRTHRTSIVEDVDLDATLT